MQPLAYLAVRAMLGWIQFVERSERAFLSSALLQVACGAVHSWAVVYSLFVAVHTRAMRYDGYHEGYVEHLPSTVAASETLAVASSWIWVLAGFTTAAVRILDDDVAILPSGMEDLKGNPITRLIRSPVFTTALGHLHSVSCVGLFTSILSLCISMAFMKGAVTACELCLALVSIVFALPHAVLAIGRLSEGAENVLAQLLPDQFVEAAASEAAALGPQLCIILALADTPGHAYLWQNLVYVGVSAAFLSSVVACARNPPKSGGTALPPEVPETMVCFIVDGITTFVIILSYPQLNTWLFWLCAVVLAGVAFGIATMPPFREFYNEWLEPLLVTRGDTFKRLKGEGRQMVRKGSWAAILVCAVTALWDIMLHPVPQAALGSPFEYNPPLPNLLMLRWQPSSEGGASQHLSTAAEVLGVDASTLQLEETFNEHRLMLFRYTGTPKPDEAPVLMSWQAAMMAPSGKLASVADSSFPAALNSTMCSSLQDKFEVSSANVEKQEARAAYVAACGWWKNRLLSWESVGRKAQ
mmetsp:Transcript_152890/g.490457  ORF Transcript_152890/g.490457 Transcript_152890/m.490457 type:complete len:527 (-) Transcript_152890:301-1881(-)